MKLSSSASNSWLTPFNVSLKNPGKNPEKSETSLAFWEAAKKASKQPVRVTRCVQGRAGNEQEELEVSYNESRELHQENQQKALLHKQYEELKQITRRPAELKLLQGLEGIKIPYHDDWPKYETELINAKQQAHTLQCGRQQAALLQEEHARSTNPSVTTNSHQNSSKGTFSTNILFCHSVTMSTVEQALSDILRGDVVAQWWPPHR